MRFSTYSIILFTIFIFCILFQGSVGENFSQRRRRTKELEEKINKLDDATKQRIYAMKAAGMPRDAIAEKISYVAGGKGTARRIVDALHDEPSRAKPGQPKPKPKSKPQQQQPKQQQQQQQQKPPIFPGGSSASTNKKPATNPAAGKKK